MKLILVRHGLAVDRENFIKSKKDDSLRPLVIKGKKKSIDMAKYLKKWVGQVDLLVCSPYLRAKQTAMIFQRTLKVRKRLEAMELIPSAPPVAFAQWLQANAGMATSVLVVGHEPQLSVFASWVLSGQMHSFIDLKKSGIVGIDIESLQDIHGGSGDLKFLVQPKIFD